MKEGAGGLVRGMDMAAHPERRVAVTEYRSFPNRLCELTNDEAEALSCVERIDTHGESSLGFGMLDGSSALSEGRPPQPPDPRESLVALAGGVQSEGCGPVLYAADRAKAQGVTVYTICLGPECDPSCLRQAASGPERFHLTMQASMLIDVFEAIAQQIVAAADPSATPVMSSTPTGGTAGPSATPTATGSPTASRTATATGLPTIAPTPTAGATITGETPTALVSTATRTATSFASPSTTPSGDAVCYLPFSSRGWPEP
jgi:hypothetical protein